MLWVILAIFLVATSLIPGIAPAQIENVDTTARLFQYIIGSIWLAFLVYSLYCSYRESLVKTVRRMASWHWGRQIGLDLYLGLLMFCGLIFLVEGNVWIALVWLVPTLIYGNLVPLFYAFTRLPVIVMAFQQGT